MIACLHSDGNCLVVSDMLNKLVTYGFMGLACLLQQHFSSGSQANCFDIDDLTAFKTSSLF